MREIYTLTLGIIWTFMMGASFLGFQLTDESLLPASISFTGVTIALAYLLKK